MISLTETELNEIESICNGYTYDLYKFEINTNEYSDLKHKLDEQFCGLNIWQEQQMLHAELKLGNVILENNIMTCIFDNKIHRFRMVKRKANNGEYAYITGINDISTFDKKYIGRCFKVDRQPSPYMRKDCVLINEVSLYDSQYVVLDEIQEVA